TEEITGLAADFLGAHLGSEDARPLEVHVAHADDAHAGRRLQVAAMDAGDAAAADQADTEVVGGSAHAMGRDGGGARTVRAWAGNARTGCSGRSTWCTSGTAGGPSACGGTSGRPCRSRSC